MRRTIEATTMVTMMIKFDAPPYLSKPTPETMLLEYTFFILNPINFFIWIMIAYWCNFVFITTDVNFARNSISYSIFYVACISSEILFQCTDTYVASHAIYRNIIFSEGSIFVDPTELYNRKNCMKNENSIQIYLLN